MRLAGKLIDLVKKVPGAPRFAQAGGKDIVKGSIPGALITSGMSAVTTGNPIAGLTVGVADLAASSLMGRALASRTLSNQLGKVAAGGGRGSKIAGKLQTVLPGKFNSDGQYMMSLPQTTATAVGSLGATLTLEPYFYPRQEAAVLAQQYPQLSNIQLDQSQMVTQAQQLSQLKQQNNLGQQALSPGTMYQLQGMPLATDPGIDPYNIMRGQF